MFTLKKKEHKTAEKLDLYLIKVVLESTNNIRVKARKIWLNQKCL